ncbi:hypothetical protein ACJX0J_009152, partial [Zea mays]
GASNGSNIIIAKWDATTHAPYLELEGEGFEGARGILDRSFERGYMHSLLWGINLFRKK